MASSTDRNTVLADQARALFTERARRVLPELAKNIGDKLAAMAEQPGSARDVQEQRDALLAFQKSGPVWVQCTISAWSTAQTTPRVAVQSRFSDSSKFELMGNEVMENQILASRLALRLLDFASWELNDLRLRIQHLEAISELHKDDIFRPEVLARHMAEQWTDASLPRDLWMTVQDLIQKTMAERMRDVYHATNEFLVRQGVMAEIDLRPLVRRTPSAITANSAFKGSPEWAPGRTPPAAGVGDGIGGAASGMDGFAASAPAGDAVGGRAQASRSAGNPVFDETRMQTATTPLARARMRAQGVMGHLKRLLSSQVSGFDDPGPRQASAPLVDAMASMQRAQETGAEHTLLADPQGQVYGQAHVDQAMGALRARTGALKQAAATTSEKATIEIVALMFQSILAEDRIPAGIRVWFARLQMPVLRLAISEPEFFGSLQHPARRLIDRMGSCALGFDVTVSGGAMESEIKRIVQVIEQYPETGRRVFQLVYDEFDKFLSRFLSEQGSTARVVSVAQQVEQKETMAIQYTIEMRNMLNDMPVRDGIREFLFKIWAEVLAIAAMKNGPQHPETITLKRAASDLVWAASAKPNRSDRARVIADLPKLLQLLRLGMSMIGLETPEQDRQLKAISDTLADAFMSKTDAIPMERVEVMAKRLANLEEYLSDEDVGDLPLDMDSLVTMIGIDSATVEVITDGGSQPTEAMRAWARELQLGAWFSLDHNGKVSHVQFAWCSDRKQLHLFAAVDGRNFLIQARRLAAYLQAGLLVPTEEEALTVRATRDALAKLHANPERLLG
ncbi:MAG: DUF1631 family protein [Polaromonas sp.]|nr:DUF1631 family protein [Polaromonas sp.]MDP2257696.1 DUF1631 family protein [Polaromonas sp.]MDP3707591.1 DUF1631 family protein [Polaromonas sp.]